MAILDAICRAAAADPLSALFIAGMLIGVIVVWAWSDEWRGASW